MIKLNLRYLFIIVFLVFTSCQAASGWCEDRTANRLINESSPYLLKHATNPVEWYPWSEEAFSLARENNKPIFLSIGYLTCHWCNVMEEESFSDQEVAALINEVFIPIKVDREERPDIDQIYMQACYLLTPSCGWPLTLFLTPDGKPFYAGTYIPKGNRFGRLGLMELIPRVKELWAQERESVLKSADTIQAAIISSSIQLPGNDIKAADLDKAFQAFAQDFDTRYGGFGAGAKFPKPLNLLFLLRYWHRTGNSTSLAMVEKTLTAMRQGSIFDQLGHGFHRYTTDARWRKPHFEKMLYDQALLAMVYLEAYQVTGKKKYARTAKEILAYVLQYLTGKEGVFYAAESADSDGEEGKFYLWSAEELGKVLNPQEALQVRSLFHITEEGNYIDPVAGQETGRNILYIDGDMNEAGEFEKIRQKLLAVRDTRQRPERDDKVLTDWNGLMIAALAKAAQVLGQPEYGDHAKRAASFILNNMRTPDGTLLHRWRNGRSGLTATAADYSFLIWGLLELYNWNFDTSWLQHSLDLSDILIAHYWEDTLGGFYLTPANEKSMLPRIKQSIDTQLPSSNAVSMYNLLKISRLTGNPLFEEKAARISRLFSTRALDSPLAFPMLLVAIDFALAPSQEVVIVGREAATDTKTMLNLLRKNYFPNTVVIFKPAGVQEPSINKYAGFVEFMYAMKGNATAYVCTNFKCNFPTTDPARMLESLESITRNKKKNEP